MEWYTKEMKDLEQDLHVVDLVNNLRARIAELEAEVERLKDMHKAKWKDAYSRICANTTEEGEG